MKRKEKRRRKRKEGRKEGERKEGRGEKDEQNEGTGEKKHVRKAIKFELRESQGGKAIEVTNRNIKPRVQWWASTMVGLTKRKTPYISRT